MSRFKVELKHIIIVLIVIVLFSQYSSSFLGLPFFNQNAQRESTISGYSTKASCDAYVIGSYLGSSMCYTCTECTSYSGSWRAECNTGCKTGASPTYGYTYTRYGDVCSCSTVSCTPNKFYCVDSTHDHQCNSAGDGWLATETCGLEGACVTMSDGTGACGNCPSGRQYCHYGTGNICCPTGQVCGATSCVSGSTSCQDTDNGLIYTSRGQLTYSCASGTTGSKQDYCYPTGELLEYGCSLINLDTCTIGYDLHDCGSGKVCTDGVCVACSESWTCTNWGVCISGTQTRTCTDANECGTTTTRPTLSQSCSATCIKGEVSPSCNGVIDTTEMVNYIKKWISGDVQLTDVITVVKSFKGG